MSRLLMRFPEGKSKALTFSFDDGTVQDRTLVQLFNEHNIKCTFNLNSGELSDYKKEPERPYMKKLSREEAVSLYSDDKFEIAAHGYTHPLLGNLSDNVQAYEILHDRAELENMFSDIIRGFVYPSHSKNSNTVNILKSCGMSYARNAAETKKFDLPEDWYELSPTCHYRNPDIYALCEKFLNDTPGRNPYWFYIYGHSFEFDKYNDWDEIKKLIETLANNDSVWYATTIEVYDYIKAFENLSFSCNKKYVLNNSNTDVWIKCNNNLLPTPDSSDLYKIPAGEKIELDLYNSLLR